jgi:hypothetical protein
MPPALATPMKQDSLPKSIPITGVVAIFLLQQQKLSEIETLNVLTERRQHKLEKLFFNFLKEMTQPAGNSLKRREKMSKIGI